MVSPKSVIRAIGSSMCTEPQIGCCGYPGNRQRYQRELDLVELQQTFRTLPNAKTARRWRDEAPADFSFSLKAWQTVTHRAESPTYRGLDTNAIEGFAEVGHFQQSAAVAEGWRRTRQIAEALRASAVVFESPSDFTPTVDNRDRLKRFFESIERLEGCRLVWDPRGLWETETCQSIADDLELVLCDSGDDPMRPLQPNSYLKLRHASLGSDDLERLAPRVLECDQALVLIATNEPYAWARRLQLLLKEYRELG
jgi:uncharacterized protein YecE (DUF72 family)